MKKCLFCFGNSFKQGPAELRVRHIEAFGFLIDLQVLINFLINNFLIDLFFQESDRSNELLAITERWFSWLEGTDRADDSCKLIFDLFRQPFPEIHLAAGQIFKKLSVLPWGQKLMAKQAG